MSYVSKDAHHRPTALQDRDFFGRLVGSVLVNMHRYSLPIPSGNYYRPEDSLNKLERDLANTEGYSVPIFQTQTSVDSLLSVVDHQ